MRIKYAGLQESIYRDGYRTALRTFLKKCPEPLDKDDPRRSEVDTILYSVRSIAEDMIEDAQDRER